MEKHEHGIYAEKLTIEKHKQKSANEENNRVDVKTKNELRGDEQEMSIGKNLTRKSGK